MCCFHCVHKSCKGLSKNGELSWAELNWRQTIYIPLFIDLWGQDSDPAITTPKQPLPSTPSPLPHCIPSICPAPHDPCSPKKNVSTEAQEAKGVLQRKGKGWERVSTSLLPLLRSKPVCSLEGRLAPFIACPTCLDGTALCPFPFLLELEGSSRVGLWAISSASKIPPP